VLVAAALASQSPPPESPAAAPTAIRLVYELPVDELQRALREQPGRDLEQVLAETVESVQVRLGTAKVARHVATGFTVDLANADAAAIELARRRVETVGRLEMRIVAGGDYRVGDVSFDLAAERTRLLAWLDAGGREKLRADPTAIAAFHDDPKGGPLAGKNLRWFVHRIEADRENAGQWLPSYRTHLRDACIPAYADKDWQDGVIPAHIRKLPRNQQYLVELMAVNMHEMHFANRDLDPKGISLVQGADGGPGLQYRIVDARAGDYARWSEKYIGQCSAILWNDEVLSAPCFMSRIPGRGMITGALSAEELETMELALQAPPLATRPRFVRQEPAPK
jgi:hypothetical protein